MNKLPIILALIAIATSFVAWWPEAAPKSTSLGHVGDIFGKQAPVEQIADLTVWTWDEELKASSVFQVKKDGAKWIIPSRFNYPADGATRLGKTSGGVMNVARGRFVSDDPKRYEELGVIDPSSDSPDLGQKGRGKRVALKDQSGGVLVDLIIGKSASGSDGMCYVREQSSKDVYLAKVDSDISTKFIDWVEPDLLKIKKEDVTSLMVGDYSVDEANGRINERSHTVLNKEKDKDEWNSPDAPADKRVAKTAIDKLLNDLTGLRLANIRPFLPDPMMLKECGFYLVPNPDLVNRPDAYVVEAGGGQKLAVVPNEGEISVTTKDGIRYRIFFGEIALGDEEKKKDDKPEGEQKDEANPEDKKDEKHDRYMVVFCQYDPASDLTPKEETKPDDKDAKPDAKPKEKKPTGQAKAEKAQDRFLKFFYVISNTSFEALRPKADTLFEAKPVEVMAGDSSMSNAARLEANGKKPGVVTTASGLQYEVITAAKKDAKQPKDGDDVTVKYKGTLVDGTEFDSSKDSTATFNVNGVIKGWTEALKLMREGDKWRLFIPSELAYGEAGSPPKIGANQILVFEVELVKAGK